MILNIFSDSKGPDVTFPFHIYKGVSNGDYLEHQHNFTEVVFVIGGEAVHKVGKTTKKLGKGDVFVITNPVSHQHVNMKNFTHYDIQFDLQKLTLLDDEIKQYSGFHSLFYIEPNCLLTKEYNGGLVLNDEQLNYATAMLDIMCDAYNSKHSGYKIIIRTHLIALMVYISHCHSPMNETISNHTYKISETLAFIENNCEKKILVKELAAIACLSERQYNRVFTNTYGISPVDYIIKTRLNKACRLLENQELSIHNISIQCGFFDSAYFNKQFKIYFNMTPSEYRKKAFLNLLNNKNT